MHLATTDLTIALKNGEVINPVERGHIAFRTDDIEAFKALLDQHSIPYSDYGTAFAGVCQTSCPLISCSVSDFRSADIGFWIEPDGSSRMPVSGFA